jgi:beta-mannosidase
MMNKTDVRFMAVAVSLSTLTSVSALAAATIDKNVTRGQFAEALDVSVAPAFSEKALPAYKATPLTVELWCKLNGSSGYNVLVSNEPKESCTHWELYTEPGGLLSAYLPGVTPSILRTAKNLADNKWHAVAMVLDGESVALFADGKEELRAAVSKNPAGAVVAGPLAVGQATFQNRTFDCDGAVDEVRLSSCVRDLSQTPAAPFSADAQTVGLWHFDLVKGAKAFADASASNNPMSNGDTGVSKSELDRASFKAGPSPLDSPAQAVSLKAGSLKLPGLAPVCSLDGEWQLAEGTNLEERLAGVWAEAMKAPVPGSVHTALFQAGVIPHPFLERNQEIARGWSFKSYYYRKVFPRPAKGQDETLVFEGVCNRCTIWLNGKKLGEHEGMFDSIRCPVGKLLQDENTLVVKLDSAIVDWQKTVVFNNSYGWHYSKFPPLGIWRSVGICGEPAVRVRSPFVATRDAAKGVVELMATIGGLEQAWSGKLAGVIAPENFKGKTFHFEQDFEAQTGAKEVHLRFTLPDPKLWWPVDMGAPNLYRLRLAFTPKGEGRADVQEFCFGIRTVEMAPVDGRPSSKVFNWTFVINGQPLFVKGTGWCTADAMMDFSRARYDRLLSLAADQHIQMLRAWGSGMVETEDFYDLCDRKGIMVMQEWPTAWDSHLKQPFDMLERTVREGTLRLRHHPSLVIYTGGNESCNPYGAAIDMMGRLNIELDGTREFHRGEPAGGSAHDYDVYWGGHHIDHAFTMKAIFYGEFGVAAYPCYESVQRFLPDAEKNLWPAKSDGSFAYHTPIFNTAKDLERLTRMSQYFTEGATMERYIVGSQLGQAVGVRHALERMRTRWPVSTGALYYKLNDNSPAASWSTVDWYGTPKIAHYLIQDSFAPLVAAVIFEKASSYGVPLSMPVFLLDDADVLKDAPWEVLVRAFGSDLKQIKELRFMGQGSINKVRSLGEFALDESQTKTAPLLMVMDVLKNGVLVQRNYNFTNFETVKDCLFNLPKANVSMEVKDGEAIVKNMGALPAVGVNISRPGHLDTFTVEDNYFWLDAGETKSVKVNDTKDLVVDAWNLEKRAGSE